MSKENLSTIFEFAGPTPQEELLLAINAGAYDVAVDIVAADIRDGRSPSFLSVIRPDLLLGFARTWQGSDIHEIQSTFGAYKAGLFETYAAQAHEGDPAALDALPKFATTIGQLATAMELVLAHEDKVIEWRTGQAYLQYLGTFDPQHIGHRIAIHSALETTTSRSQAIAHVMGEHPFKSSFRASYDERYLNSEKRLYESSLLDNMRVTQIDVPGGVGLANRGLAQMELIADVCGDRDLRWLTGSDKFMLDANAIREGRAGAKAVTRFSDPRMHVYIVRRQSDELSLLENGMDYVNDRFGSTMTLVEELPYDCAPASSTRIKELRAEGDDAAADHMEFYELAQ